MKYTDIKTLAEFKSYCVDNAADQELVQKQVASVEETIVALVRVRYRTNSDVIRWPRGSIAYFEAPDIHENHWHCVVIFYVFPDGYRIGMYSVSTDASRAMVEKVLVASNDMLQQLKPQ